MLRPHDQYCLCRTVKFSHQTQSLYMAFVHKALFRSNRKGHSQTVATKLKFSGMSLYDNIKICYHKMVEIAKPINYKGVSTHFWLYGKVYI